MRGAPSATMVRGFVGDLVRSSSCAPTAADIRCQILPGLGALGVDASLARIDEGDQELIRRLRERLRYGVSVPVLTFERAEEAQSDTAPGLPVEDASEEVSILLDDLDVLGREGVVVEVEMSAAGTIRWIDADRGEQAATPAVLRGQFTHLLLLRRAPKRGRRRANLTAALLRWIAFADAYPRRIAGSLPGDRPMLTAASEFLRMVSGRGRDPVATRLRRASILFGSASGERDVKAAMRVIRDAVFRELRLPITARAALLDAGPISPIARRELIYLGRAGTREIRAIAARRLLGDVRSRDVAATVAELRHDPEPWVRASTISS